MTSNNPSVRDPRLEAANLVGHELIAHVLEPAPPAIDDGEWFADDPLAPVGVPAVLPAGIEREGTTSWTAWLADHPDNAEWVKSHWLGGTRADDASVDASRPQLWPGHFDPAIEIGDEDHRGSYGASPGDDAIAEPYLYVSAWWPGRIDLDADNPAWNAPSFTGSILKLSDFPPGDPADIAATFFGSIRDLIAA